MNDQAALTRQERIERGQANRKAREELRNAVRFCMKEGGVTPADINKAAHDMAVTAVGRVLGSITLNQLVRNAVEVEISRQMGLVQKALPGGLKITEMIALAMQKEASRVAAEYMKTNIVVSVNDAGGYKEGGSF